MMNNNTENMNTDEYLYALSERLCEIVSRKDWSLTKLSLETGISYRELHAIINREKGDIRLSTLVKISQSLNEPIANLIGIGVSPIRDYMKAILRLHREAEGYLKRGASI